MERWGKGDFGCSWFEVDVGGDLNQGLGVWENSDNLYTKR